MGLACFANMLWRADLRRAARLAADVGPSVALVVLPWAVVMAFQTIGYVRILGVLARRPPFLRVLSVLVSGEAVLMSMPGGGAIADGLNPYLLNRRCGVPYPEGLAAVAARKSLIVLTNGIYMAIAVIAGGAWLGAASQALLGGSGLRWVVTAAAAVLFFSALVLSRALLSGTLAARSHALLRRIPSARLARWLAAREPGFAATDRHFAALAGAGGAAFATAGAAFLAAWLVEGAEAWLILRLLHVDVSYAEVIAFEVVVSLLRSMAFMVPAGIGVQDAGYVAFFGAFGIPDAPTVGVAFVLIKRAKEIVWIAIGLSLFPLMGDRPRPAAESPT